MGLKQKKSKVKKFDDNKWRLSDVPQKALKSVAEVFNYGANKYGKFNYSGTIEASRLYDACQRHLYAWNVGENTDESGKPHLAHAIASLMMLLDGFENKTVKDDRNKIYKIK